MPAVPAKAKLTNAALRPVLDMLRSRLPRLVIETGQEPLILTYRRRGEFISDPACQQNFRIDEDGIFRCRAIEQGEQRGHRWTHYASPRDFARTLKEDLAHFTQSQLDDVLRDAAWQAEYHLGVKTCAAKPNPDPPLSSTVARQKRRARETRWRPNNACFMPRLPSG
ncbi:MAG: hypothetical protein WA384_20080 [Rhodomicrobium sp.]